eukprot:RCo045875
MKLTVKVGAPVNVWGMVFSDYSGRPPSDGELSGVKLGHEELECVLLGKRWSGKRPRHIAFHHYLTKIDLANKCLLIHPMNGVFHLSREPEVVPGKGQPVTTLVDYEGAKSAQQRRSRARFPIPILPREMTKKRGGGRSRKRALSADALEHGGAYGAAETVKGPSNVKPEDL